jgi:hypothetical protein
MTYMIRNFYLGSLLLFLQSCSYFNFYQETASLIVSTVKPINTEVTNKFYDDFDYSFAKLRIGRSGSLIVVLLSYEDGVYEWVSSDNIILKTNRFGKIISTRGLNSDIFIKKLENKVLDTEENFAYYLDYTNPDLISAFTESKIKDLGYQEFSYLSDTLNVRKFREDVSISKIFWSNSNTYFFYEDRPLYTEQKIHPNIPEIRLTFYLK